MKRTNFLSRLHNEGKLKVIEPSSEIKDAYLQRAKESLSSAKILFEMKNLKDSVALAYFAMYHTLLALLFRVGIKCENHTAGIIPFSINNGALNRKKTQRH